MSLDFKTLRFVDVKAEGDGSEFSGYAAAFNNCDIYGDVIVPGAFAKSLPDFIKNGQICFNHGEVIGKPLEAHEDAKGLFVRGKISDTMRGRDCKTLLKDEVFRKMSIGYRPIQRRSVMPDELRKYWQERGYQPDAEDEANLTENARYLNFLAEIKLYEASPVGFPANTHADITGVKDGLMKLSDLRSLIFSVKEGRKLSSAMRERLGAHHESLKCVVKDLGELLKETDPSMQVPAEPEPDEDDEDESEDSNSKRRARALAKARAELALVSSDPLMIEALLR